MFLSFDTIKYFVFTTFVGVLFQRLFILGYMRRLPISVERIYQPVY
jgi:hypothetical protein